MVDIEAFPWLVHIGIHFYGNSKPTGRCGGSIITRHLVLTVAHCIDTYVTKVSLLIGDHNVTSFYQGDSVHHTVTSDNFVQHPKYNRMTLENDIGLIRLEKPGIEFERGRIIPICLGVPSDLRTGMKARTMGWGVTGVGIPLPDVLYGVEVDIISNEVCQKLYENFWTITDNMVCALTPGQDACQICLHKRRQSMEETKETPIELVAGRTS
ncbi:trypsin V-B-like isoform X2 [Oratosquilla oratoria]|uniref:trypsin V-B-like isoform X2 n=1 Tax=Oratosquilla oratoria TaxID=337810 RepID=UPI003F772188